MWTLFLCGFVMLISSDEVLSQVPDYETTPFPLPPTSFSCQGRSSGYYADVETGCRTYHVCDGASHFTYICPARTLFQQRSRICDHAYLVRCEDAPTFFEDIYPEDEDEILRLLVESEDSQTELFDDGSTEVEIPATEAPEPTTTTPTTTTPTTTTTTTTTTTRPTTVQTPRSVNLTSVNYSSQTSKTVKFVIKDTRSLFYIPEVDNNSISIQAEREFVLPVERKNLLKFRNGKKIRHTFSACPGYCDPKFFLPGTCHPCIMIK